MKTSRGLSLKYMQSPYRRLPMEIHQSVAIGRSGQTARTFTEPALSWPRERLRQQSGLLSAQVTDWRSMVDSVMIDRAYNGQVFQIALADIPERKTDLVAGRYTLPAPPEEARVAVMLVDMLGEEVLVTARV